jgi:hypothetical protein
MNDAQDNGSDEENPVNSVKNMKHGRKKSKFVNGAKPGQVPNSVSSAAAANNNPGTVSRFKSNPVASTLSSGGNSVRPNVEIGALGNVAASAGSSADSVRFWGQFLDSPNAAKQEPKYHKFVWGGVPSELNLRRQVWPLLSKNIQDAIVPNPGQFKSVDEATLEEIMIELANQDLERYLEKSLNPSVEPKSPTATLTRSGTMANVHHARDAVKDLVKLVHEALNHQKRYIPGSVQLAALLLIDVCDFNTQEAFKILYGLLVTMQDYMADNYKRLRNECLVIADILSREVGSLAQRFNETGFDVVDMTDLLCIWSSPLFIYHFPKEFVLRVMDLLFAEGPVILGNVIFAIIFVFQEELDSIKVGSNESKEGETGRKLYATLYDIPSKINAQKLEKIFKSGYEMILNFPKMAELRMQKDWSKTIEVPGPLRFKKGVGDATSAVEEKKERSPVRPSGIARNSSRTNSPLMMKKIISEIKEENDRDDDQDRNDEFDNEEENNLDDDEDEEEDQDLEEIVPVITLEEVEAEPNPEVIFDKIKKITESNNRLRRKVDASKTELKDRSAKITQLELEIETLESRIRGTGGSSPLGLSVPASQVIANFVLDSKALEAHGPNAVRISELKIADDDSKYHSFDLNDFNTAYSTIYEQMDFPCVYMEGYLFKLSKTGMFGKLNLIRRWFVLKGRFLTYFKSHMHSKPTKDRCVDVRGCIITPLAKHPKGDYVFEISNASGDHKFLLFAPDQKEMYKWLIALKAAVAQ